MKVDLKIEHIQYEDVALKLVSALKKNGSQAENAAGKIINALADLPEDVVCSVAAAISEEDMNDIISRLVEENQEKILDSVAGLLQKQEIRANVGKISLTKDLNAELVVERIDYTAVVMKFLPIIVNMKTSGNDNVGAVLAGVQKMPGFLVRNMLDAMPQEKKDEIVIYLINYNKRVILEKLTNLALDNGMRIVFEDISASV